MHSIAESEYQAANEWLKSLGDADESDDDQYESTIASSPSDVLSRAGSSRKTQSDPATLHACMTSPLSHLNRNAVANAPRHIITKTAEKEPVTVEVIEQAVDKRMKGDVCISYCCLQLF